MLLFWWSWLSSDISQTFCQIFKDRSSSIVIPVTHIFASIFRYQTRSNYLSYFSFSFILNLWSAETAKSAMLLLLLLLSYSFKSFSHQRLRRVFHSSLSDSKSPQVSRTHLSILANHKKAVILMVSIIIRFPTLTTHFQILQRPFQVCQLHLISWSPKRSTTF